MLNILKTDFYKAFRTPAFWIISTITVLSSLLMSFSFFWIHIDPDSAAISEIMISSGTNFFTDAFMVMSSCIFLIGIFSILFSVSDFNHGTIKNIASKGYHREYIYLSKFFTLICFAALFLLISFITSFITAQVMINTKIPGFFNYNNTFQDAFLAISKYALLSVTYISIAVFCTTLFRSTGAAMSVFLGYFYLESSAVSLINKLIHDVFNSDFSVAPYSVAYAFSDVDKTTHGIIVLLVYIVVTTVIGLYTFKKRDIN